MGNIETPNISARPYRTSKCACADTLARDASPDPTGVLKLDTSHPKPGLNSMFSRVSVDWSIKTCHGVSQCLAVAVADSGLCLRRRPSRTQAGGPHPTFPSEDSSHSLEAVSRLEYGAYPTHVFSSTGRRAPSTHHAGGIQPTPHLYTFGAVPAMVGSGADYTNVDGSSLRDGEFLYRLTRALKLGGSRVARSYTRPHTGETCGPVLRRVVKHPAASVADYGASGRTTELRRDRRTAAMHTRASICAYPYPGEDACAYRPCETLGVAA